MKKQSTSLIDDSGEVNPLNESMDIQFSLLRNTFPALAEYSEKRRAGRPKIAKPKKLKSFKLAQDVIEAIVSSGKGYNARVEAVLRKAFIGAH